MSQLIVAHDSRLKISKIATAFPERIVSNDALIAEHPSWNVAKLAEKTGVHSRHIAASDETALDLALTACEKLFVADASLKSKIDAIVFCTQSPDHIMPPNSCLLQARLGLPNDVLAYDFNLACSGYTYGLAMAQGWLAMGLARGVLFVTADTYSKYINPKDRSVVLLFGDGAAASFLTKESDGSGLIDIALATYGKGYEGFHIPAGGCRMPRSEETAKVKFDLFGNGRSQEQIKMNGNEVLDFVKVAVPKQVHELLSRNNTKIEDLKLVIAHQASLLALTTLAERLGLPREKMYSNIRDIGNTVSASIPMAIADAESEGRLKRGDLILLTGFGVGLSYASALMVY